MSFAHGGSLGTNSSKTSSSSLSVTVGTNVGAGTLVAVWASWDNDNSSTALEFRNELHHVDCWDSQGNLYMRLIAGCTNGNQQRAYGNLFLSKITTGLTTSDTITTAYYQNMPAKAMSVEYFTMDTSKIVAVVSRVFRRNDLGVDPAALTIPSGDDPGGGGTSLPTQEYLLLHMLAAEGPSTDAYTWDADYTQITSAGTTGGADDSNQTINGSWRIATLNTDTVDVTSDTADRNYTHGLVALAEVDRGSPFPTTSILDTFTRADEDPMNAGLWDTSNAFASGTSNLLQVISNRCAARAGTNAGQQYLTLFGSYDLEAYATVITAPSVSGDKVDVGVNANGVPLTNFTADGLSWALNANNPHTNGQLQIGRDAGYEPYVQWLLHPADGYKLGIRRIDPYVYAWVDTGGGWQCIGAYWNPISIDAAHTPGNKERIGINGRQEFIRMDDFGGGVYRRLRFPQQIRRPWARG